MHKKKQFVWLPAKCLLLVCRKNASGACIVSARFGKQHFNLVNPKIDCSSFCITGGLSNAQKGVSTLSYEYQ
jgi:hypothetical protein